MLGISTLLLVRLHRRAVAVSATTVGGKEGGDGEAVVSGGNT